MWNAFPRSLHSYLLAVVLVLIALEVKWLIEPYTTVSAPFLPFLAAIIVIAWHGGFRPALMATLLSALLIDYYFFAPLKSFALTAPDLATLMLFVLEGGAIAYFIDRLEYSRQEAVRKEIGLHQENVELEHRITQKKQQILEAETRSKNLVTELAFVEEREREQLATELHDYLAQMLTLAKIRLRQAQEAIHRSPKDVPAYLGKTDNLLQQSLDYARSLMAELCPRLLHESGFLAAVRWLVEQMPKHGLTVDLFVACEGLVIPEDQAVLLYRSIRELLINVVKHAAVDRAKVRLAVEDNHVLVISVRDAGRGFDMTAVRPTIAGEHFGLSSIQERLAAMGGWLQAESVLGEGSTLTMHVPVSPSNQILRAAAAAVGYRVKVKPQMPANQQTLPLE